MDSLDVHVQMAGTKHHLVGGHMYIVHVALYNVYITFSENGCAKSILTQPIFLVSIDHTPFSPFRKFSGFLLPP